MVGASPIPWCGLSLESVPLSMPHVPTVPVWSGAGQLMPWDQTSSCPVSSQSLLAFLQPLSPCSHPASLLPTALSKLLSVHLGVPGAGRKKIGVKQDLEGISKGARRRNC